MRDSILGLAFACLLAQEAAAQAEVQEFRVGQSQSGLVQAEDPRLVLDGPTRRLRLRSSTDGKVTISANSFDFDVYLRVETEAGDILGEADDGGIETNARLVVEVRRDKRYDVLVTAKGGGSGWFRVDCQAGERPAPSREAVQLAAVAYHGSAANAELAKAQTSAAAAHLARKGALLLELGRFEQAQSVFESARTLWTDSTDPGERKSAIRATLDLGRVASGLKDWKTAEARFAEALAAFRALPDAAGEARTLVFQAAARAAAGDSAAASTLYQEALALAEKHADAENAALALAGTAALSRAPGDREEKRETAGKLGDLWRAGGDLEKAREEHRKEVQIARESKNRAAEASALLDLGKDWLQALELAHARECFEDSLRIATETGNPSARGEALDCMGEVWFKLQEYPKALRCHEQQLELAGSDATRAGRADLRIGQCCSAMHDFPRARTSLESSLRRARDSGDRGTQADALEYLSLVERQTDHPDESQRLKLEAQELRKGSSPGGPSIALERGFELVKSGDIASAQELFEQSLEQARSSGDVELKMEASLWLGLCHQERGHQADAIRCFSEMVELARTLSRRLDEGLGQSLLGQRYLTVGALESALKSCEEALAIAREVGDPVQELDALNCLGNVWLELHQTEKAREFYEQVGPLGRKLGVPIAEAVALNNVGTAYWDAGRYAEGRPFLEQAVQFASELQAPSYLAEAQANLARVLRKLGERDRARELANESLAVLGAPDFGEPRKALIPLEALAPLAIADGDVAGARAVLDRADTVLDAVRVDAQAAPGEVGADPWILFPHFDPFRQDLVRETERGGGLAPGAHEKLLEQGFRDADRARARHLASGIVGHRRGSRSKDTLKLREEWKVALAQLSEKQKEASQAIRNGKPSEEVDRLQLEVLARRSNAENLGDALRELSPGDAALDLPEGVDPAAVRKTSAMKDCALIEYADGDEDLYAYVLTEKGLAFLPLGPRKTVDAVVERYVAMLGAQKGPASPNEIAQVGQQLFDLLLAAPLAAAGQGTARLLVVPTPSLAVLPFDALVVSTKPDVQGFEDLEFAIDRFEVDYCPSASILVMLSSAGTRILDGKVLVLADPTYPSETPAIEASAPTSAKPAFLAGRRGTDGKEFQRLTKTRDEANTIAALVIQPAEIEAQARLTRLQKERSGPLRANAIDLYVGADASAARLAGDLRPYTYLHLAAHGWVDSQNPEKTGIALAWSGSGEYQGFFTLADAVGLDLDADLVVLSACETARGKVRVGEGVESMGCAFLNAGSRGVVASLWQVEDQAAAETMKSLYEGIIVKAMTPAAALHAAKIAIRHGSISRGLAQKPGDVGRRDKGNPCDWAPFVHIGLPR